MNSLKKIYLALLAVVITVAIMSFTGAKTAENTNKKTYYYYAYHSNGLNYKYYDKAYFTPLMTISIDEDKYYPINESGLALQFGEYMESEYTNYIGGSEGAIYDSETFSKAKAMEYYRSDLKLFKSVIKKNDFEYLPERR